MCMRVLQHHVGFRGVCRGCNAVQWISAERSQPGARCAATPQLISDQAPHTPVLLDKTLEAFADTNLKVYLDCTLGAAGHAEAIIQNHPELEHFVGIDQDASALEIARDRLNKYNAQGVKLHYIHSNFRGILDHINRLSSQGSIPHGPDGILMDLGVSSMQLDRSERGFSFMKEGPLDMRMDTTIGTTAEALVNELSEQELGRIIREYGEERMWRTVARRIVDASNAEMRRLCRGKDRVTTTTQLASIIGRTRMSSAKASGNRSASARGSHPATRTFQALRIAVNCELQVIEVAIPYAVESLRPQGRLAVISFHSLEDKIVKWAMRGAAGEGVQSGGTRGRGGVEMEMLRARGMDVAGWRAAEQGSRSDRVARLVGRRAVTADADEVKENVRARSAKLRVVEKL